MMPLIVDVTPVAINRTAMYFIIRDTVAHLLAANVEIRLQALGVPIGVAEFVANDFRLHPALERRIHKRLTRLVNQGRLSRRAYVRQLNSPAANLVFDPMYMLAVDNSLPTIAYVLDLTPVTRPEWHGPNVSATYNEAFRRLYGGNVRIIAISHSTARDLWANFGIPRERVHVVGLYSRLKELPVRIPEKRFLFVGSLEARKNIIGLVEAFELSKLYQRGFTLRIVGGDGHGAERIKQAARKVRGVVLCGRLSDAELVAEYQHACALVYPSFWEGFGLPALEAKDYGLPLLLADTGALPEIGGSGTLYVDPCSVASIAAGLVALVGKVCINEQPALIDEGRSERDGHYSRQAYMERVTEIVRDVVGVSAVDCGVASDGRGTGAHTPALWRRAHRAGKDLQGLRRRLQRSAVLRSRIMPATIQSPPGDSFSLDYLFCIQQERRLRLSRALACLMRGRLSMYPVYLIEIVMAAIALVVTNVIVRSLMNERALKNMIRDRDDAE